MLSNNFQHVQYLTLIFTLKTYQNVKGGLWTICVRFGIAVSAVFAPSRGPVELDLSSQDSLKGLCNLGRVSGGEYWGHTSAQRYLTFWWFKVGSNLYPLFCLSWKTGLYVPTNVQRYILLMLILWDKLWQCFYDGKKLLVSWQFTLSNLLYGTGPFPPY